MYNGKKVLEILKHNDWILYKMLHKKQMKKLRQLKRGKYEVYITDKFRIVWFQMTFLYN